MIRFDGRFFRGLMQTFRVDRKYPRGIFWIGLLMIIMGAGIVVAFPSPIPVVCGIFVTMFGLIFLVAGGSNVKEW